MFKHMRKRITIRLAEDLRKQAKDMALAKGCSMNSLIMEGVQLVLGDELTLDKRKRIPSSQKRGRHSAARS